MDYLAMPASISSSLDHSIRSRQHIRWNRQTDLLRGFKIDDEFELRRLLYWKVGGLSAFKNLVHVGGGAAVHVSSAYAVGHKPTDFRPEAIWIYRREPVLCSELYNLCSMRIEQRTRQ